MDKKTLSERDICTKFITPALRQARWDEMLQIREEVGFTKGRIIVRGKLATRGHAKRADYIRPPCQPVRRPDRRDCARGRRQRGDTEQRRLRRLWRRSDRSAASSQT